MPQNEQSRLAGPVEILDHDNNRLAPEGAKGSGNRIEQPELLVCEIVTLEARGRREIAPFVRLRDSGTFGRRVAGIWVRRGDDLVDDLVATPSFGEARNSGH